jgi:hypothetical protein
MAEQLAMATKERRGTSRVPSQLKIPCRIKSASEEGGWRATVLNVSLDGIGLVANRPFKPGMLLTVELPVDGQDLKRTAPRLVRVTHSKPHPNNRLGNQTWVLGGIFVKKLTRMELDALRARSPALVPHHERRTSVRHTTRLKGPCPVIRATEEGPWWAKVRNVTCHGLSLIVNRPFRPGSFLAVELPISGGQLLGKPRLLRVSWVRPQPGHRWWVLGGKFLNGLTVEEARNLC